MEAIAIIITVFNRKDKTLQCLRQIYTQTLSKEISTDIFLTDGGSSDGTVEAVKHEFPTVDIEICDGLFWNRGMYRSWERAIKSDKEYNYYIWLNDDVFIYPNCLQSLLDASHEKNNQSIIVGATLDTITKSKFTYGGRINGVGIVNQSNQLTKVDYFNGNIVLIPTFVFNILGNLDYYYQHSKGDFDYGIRAKKSGINIFQCGHALGECDVHERIDRWCDPEVPILERLKILKKPNGMPPNEVFHLDSKRNLLIAVIHYFTTYLHCLFPQLWLYCKN